MFLTVFLFGLNKDDDSIDPNPNLSATPNILLIIADDMGKDATKSFPEGAIKSKTPSIIADKYGY